MAFSLSFTSCQQNACNVLVISDDSTDWVSSSIPIGDATAYVEIVIEDINGNIVTWDVSDIFHAATVQSDLVYTSTDYTDVPLPDGKYTITYNIYTAVGVTTPTYTKTLDQYFICQISCCIDTMIAGIVDYYTCDNCDDEYIKKTLDMYGLFMSMQNYIGRCNLIKAQEIYDLLDELCDWENCNCK